ncbi:ER membrane protein complex subunit 2 isoform X1 [Salvelinus sp. IW2-2015]|uniref:ER membrane protein complex subunit 2 isoform X1 n=1 Tax=Salvelinus sp. IW2-2015 TaxID=2691554 RepID=UPI0038D46844
MASVSEMYDVTWEEMRDKLRKWREDNHRNSEQIVDVGEELINEHASKLGDDIWIIYEQVMIAALDCSRDDLAWTCLQELKRQFPGSQRVKRLAGMRLEALEKTMTQHTSRLCKGYLTKKESDGVLRQMTCPPQSFDLNPIEMFWDELDRRVKEKQSTSAQHMWESFKTLEKYEDASKQYDSILQDDPTNTAARKRKISILKAQGKSAEAIRELNEYLEQFVGDQEAWHELSELYINEHDYGKAAFCLEELMMTNPHNHLYCEQYAEVKYTQGGLENLELSRKYFAQALKLNNRNMRALFGLYMSASHIAASPKVNATVKKANVKYAAWATNQINRAYQLAGRGTKENKCSVKAVEEMLESMQITMS